MGKAEEYEQEIRKMGGQDLIHLWEDHGKDGFDDSFWKDGKVLEYVVLRAFELEIEKLNKEKNENMGSVTYPYNVFYNVCDGYENPIEQIDGAIHIDELYAIVECKDYKDSKINVESLAKLRNQLARRHSNLFGIFFSATDFTAPAEILVGHMAPQLIILWSKEDLEFCLKNECFIPCLKEKYKMAVEACMYNYPFRLYHKEYKLPVSKPLF
jgi:hypothetical protein